MKKFTGILFILLSFSASFAQKRSSEAVRVVNVDSGWANNSVNTVVFRKNSLVSYKDTQFIAFYNNNQYLVLGKRKLGDKKWKLQITPYKGKAVDAHNDISIMVDGDGYLHIAWDHHNNQLHYCRSIAPGSLDLTEKMQMTGSHEKLVSYPEFYTLPNGNLLFFYRDGGSGKGNLVINYYHTLEKSWTQLHENLIDGQGTRNAYWQTCIDDKGTIHLSWVWRESPDVSSNHDMCYAKSLDGGKTWQTSTNKMYQLPITALSAEYAARIPQKSELINQTSMCTDAHGNPYIATYWQDSGTGIPQYHIIYLKEHKWKIENINSRKNPFSLSGAGTKRIPISRPQVISWHNKVATNFALIYRDEERGNTVTVAMNDNIGKSKWQIKNIINMPLGNWEPTYDTELWRNNNKLHLFLQNVNQLDSEGVSNAPAQMVQVLEWNPLLK